MLLENSIKCLTVSRGKISLLLLSIGTIFFLANCDTSALEIARSKDELGKPRMSVYFVNIPSGEAVYIEFPDAGEMLIYGGNQEDAAESMKYLYDLFQKKEGYFVSAFRDFLEWRQKINTVVIRYPNEGALGGVVNILNKMEVENLYGPLESKGSVSPPFAGVPESLLAFYLYFNPQKDPSGRYEDPTYQTRKKMITTSYKEVKYRDKFKTPEQIESDVNIQVISPPVPATYYNYIRSREDQQWVENNAAILKVRFNEVSFLFIGSIENSMGAKLSAVSSSYLKSDIVELSSPVSDYPSILDRIKPEVIVFSKSRKKVNDIYSDKLGYKAWLYSFHKRTKLVITTDGKKIYIE